MMIKVNLSPNRKGRKGARGRGKSKTAGGGGLQAGGSAGSAIALVMLVGWVAVGGTLWYVLDQKEKDTQAKRAEEARMKAEVKKIKEQIDEEYLQAVKSRYEQLKLAIEKLESQKRTPMFVMNELMNVLTQGKLPDIDEEAQRKRTTVDPDAELNPAWDASSVWVFSVVENASVIELKGGARDASDLSEFVKRLRASSRFSNVSHPNYRRRTLKLGSGNERTYIEFSLTLRVSFWD